jgi:hypothetical protein
VTLGLVGAALFAASVKDFVLLGRQATLLKLPVAWAKILIPALLIPLPFYYHNHKEIIYYITVNALGENSDIWKLHASRLTHLLYYATGAGGKVMLGSPFAFMAVVMLNGALWIFWQRRRATIARAACYAFMLLIAYVGPTLNTIKDPFLAVSFDFLLIFITLLIFRGLLSGSDKLSAGFAKVMMVLMVLVGLWTAKWPMYWGERTRLDVVTRNRYMNDLYQAIRSHTPDGKAKVLVAVSGVFANADSFGYLADKDGLVDLNFASDFTNKGMYAFKCEVDRTRFVVIGDPGNPEDDPNVPYNQMLDRTLSMLRRSTCFTLIATCPTFSGKNYYLFERRSASH